MTDICTRHLKKIRKQMDGPGSIKKSTDGHGLDLGIPWPSLAPGDAAPGPSVCQRSLVWFFLHCFHLLSMFGEENGGVVVGSALCRVVCLAR